jgi:hypothetical protein
MAEDSGLAVSDEIPDSDLADDDFAADLVGDFAGDTRDTASASGGQHPRTEAKNSSQDFDPSSVDLLRANINDIPEAHRPFVEKYQKMAKDLRANTQRKEADLQAQLQKLQEQQQSAFKPEVLTNAVRDGMRANQPDEFDNLSPEQQAAVEVVNKLINKNVSPLTEKLTQFEQLVPVIQQFIQERQTQQQSTLQQQITEAREAYQDDVDNYAPQIKALISVVNPRTGQNFTVKEAYESVSGVRNQQSEALKQQEQQVISSAKRQVASPPNGGVSPRNGNANVQMTDEDLVAELQKLGFQ